MRHLLYMVPAVTLVFLPISTNTHAQAPDPYRWCAQYGGMEGGGGRNCGFITYGQCQAAISGVGGYCEPNPFYTGPAYGGRSYAEEPRAPKHRRSRHQKND
jgi:Protein of unknown function (DUF3551)